VVLGQSLSPLWSDGRAAERRLQFIIVPRYDPAPTPDVRNQLSRLPGGRYMTRMHLIVAAAAAIAAANAPAAAAERKQNVPSGECFVPTAGVALDEAAVRRLIAVCTAVITTGNLSGDIYARAYLQRGSMYRRQGKYTLALADFSESIRYDPTSADAYTGRGNARRDLGELDLAIADHNEAIRLWPNFAMAYNNRGNAWRDKEMYDRALADYDEAIRLDPNYATAYYNRALIRLEAGDEASAIADYRQALKLNPNFRAAAEGLKELGVEK
jgi:tetratricopeptide (TPR) repeat protein